MIFSYKGFSAKGKKLSDKIEATTLAEAKAKLKAEGILYQSINEQSASLFEGLSFSRRYKVQALELSQLSRELSMYIRSGISIVSAIKIVKGHYEHHKKMALFLNTVSTALDEGKNFYTALYEQNVVILPDFFVQSIKVSESSGILDEVLIELSRFLKEQNKIAKEIKGAFSYPVFMLIFSLLMVSFMLAFVVPEITGIFEDTGQELPGITKFVIALGDFFSSNIMTILVIAIIIVSTHLSVMKFNAAYKYAVHKFVLILPLFGKITLKSELARFSYIGSLLVRSGVPFVQTINLAANILDNVVLQSLFVESSKKVVEGKKLSTALNESKIKIDKSFIQALALGEETSEVQSVLTNISELYFEENKDKIGFMLTLLEPILMIFVGLSIGFIVAAMLLPIFSMSIS